MDNENPGMVAALQYFRGSTSALAVALSVQLGKEITKERVNHWRNNGVKMPLEMAFLIENSTHGAVKAEQLRPDLSGPITSIREDLSSTAVQKDVV